MDGPPGPSCRDRFTPAGNRHRCGAIRSSSSRSRPRHGFPSSSRFATAACSSRRSPSIAAAPFSWPRIWLTVRGQVCTLSCAAMRTSRTSASSPPPTADWCSRSTTSTRRCRGPFEWDVKRLAASFAVAGRELGYDEGARRAMVTDDRPGVPPGDGELRHDAEPRRLVHTPRRGGQHPRASARAIFPKKVRQLQTQDRADAHEGQPCARSPSSAPRSMVSSDSLVGRRSSPPSRTSCPVPRRSISSTRSGT